MTIKLNTQDISIHDISEFTTAITEMMLWATLIHNSNQNPNEYEFFGKANLESKNPFFCSPDKIAKYLEINSENFQVVNFEKGSILVELVSSGAIEVFYQLAESVGLLSIIDIYFNTNLKVDISINLNIGIDLEILAIKRFEKIKRKLKKCASKK